MTGSYTSKLVDVSNFDFDILEKGLSAENLITCDTIKTDAWKRVVTVADPFPISLDGKLFVLAEVEGYRPSGRYAKKIGIFEKVGQKFSFMGETWPEDDGEYSFPFLFFWQDDIFMLPDVNRPGNINDKFFKLYRTSSAAFPFGWRTHPTIKPRGVSALNNDKVIFRHNGVWRLLVSDNIDGGRLLIYSSEDLTHWEGHAENPILRRGGVERVLNRIFPRRVIPYRPWRLGGTPVLNNGQIVIPLQHEYMNRVYGECVSYLGLGFENDSTLSLELSPSPILKPIKSQKWRSVGSHHISFAIHDDTIVACCDGFDGDTWSVGLFTSNKRAMSNKQNSPKF